MNCAGQAKSGKDRLDFIFVIPVQAGIPGVITGIRFYRQGHFFLFMLRALL